MRSGDSERDMKDMQGAQDENLKLKKLSFLQVYGFTGAEGGTRRKHNAERL